MKGEHVKNRTQLKRKNRKKQNVMHLGMMRVLIGRICQMTSSEMRMRSNSKLQNENASIALVEVILNLQQEKRL